MLQLIDTHCHLTSEYFEGDLINVLQAAADAGVDRIIVPGVNLESSRQAVELADKYPQIFAAVGVQPEFAALYSADQFAEFVQLAGWEKVVAIGEIGLDFHYQPVDVELQKAVLKVMLKLAQEAGKPVLIHSRDAIETTLKILTDWTIELDRSREDHLLNAPGIIHAFEGDLIQAKEAIRLNFALGVGGPITYKSAKLKREVFEALELENLVLETDSPYLPPHPFRGMRNEPSHIKEIALALSQISHQPLEVVASSTTNCAERIFGWKA